MHHGVAAAVVSRCHTDREVRRGRGASSLILGLAIISRNSVEARGKR